MRTDLDIFKDFAGLMGFKVEETHYKGEHIVYYDDYIKAENVITYGYDDINYLGVFNEDGEMKQGFNVSHVAHNPKEYLHYSFISRMMPWIEEKGYKSFSKVKLMPDSKEYVLNGDLEIDPEEGTVSIGNVNIYSNYKWVELIKDEQEG